MSPLTLRRKKATDEEFVEEQSLELHEERPFPGFVRVNLLPESIRERARVRRAKRIVAVLFGLVIFALAALWLVAQRDIQEAEAELVVAQEQQARLQAEAAQYAEVPAVFATASKGEEALSAAMSREVRWAFLLNQLSFATPSGVTLSTVSGSLAEAGPTQTSPGGVLPPKESVGTMTFAGTGNSFSEVAAWLDSLQTLKDYTYPFLTNSAKSDEATTSGTLAGPITWESTADLSTNALSGRYGEPTAAPEGASGGAPAPAETAPPSDGAQGGAS